MRWLADFGLFVSQPCGAGVLVTSAGVLGGKCGRGHALSPSFWPEGPTGPSAVRSFGGEMPGVEGHSGLVVCRRHGLSGWQSLLAAHPRRASGQDQGKRCNGAWILAGLRCRSRAASQLGCWQCLGPCTRPRPIPVVCVHLKCNVEPPTFNLQRPQSNVVGPISSQMERNPLIIQSVRTTAPTIVLPAGRGHRHPAPSKSNRQPGPS